MPHPVVSSERFRTNQEEADLERPTVAVDLAKSVFEVAVANERGQITERKRCGRPAFMRFLTTRRPGRVVMEACGTAHDWGRVAQRRGHRVTLLPPHDVRPFVRRNKTDRAAAEALVDAARVERIPAVPIKRAEQQALVGLHRVREPWMTTRTARINALRGLLGEHGLNLPRGAQTAVQAVPARLESATAWPAALRRVPGWMKPLPRGRSPYRDTVCRERSPQRRLGGGGGLPACPPTPRIVTRRHGRRAVKAFTTRGHREQPA